MSTIKQVGNGVSGIVIGGYIAAVIYQSLPNGIQTTSGALGPNSNVTKLFGLLKDDFGYLEFLVASVVIAALFNVKPLRPIVGAFVIIVILGMLMSKGPGSSILSYLNAFGTGQRGLFGESTSQGQSSPTASSSIVPSSTAPATIGA